MAPSSRPTTASRCDGARWRLTAFAAPRGGAAGLGAARRPAGALATMTRPLSLLESRVAGVLVEKSHTVPDSYPLSLNALTLGCNQKTARDPVLAASEAEVQGAVDSLKALSLAF